MEELNQEEVLDDTQPTDYDSEYNKAWDNDGEVEETVEEELEQPQTEDEADADEQEESEVIEDSNNQEEEVSEEAENSESEHSEEFTQVLKWKGKEIPVTMEELIALGQKGFDSEKKWQEAAINRPIKEVIDKFGLSAEHLTMLGNIVKDKNPEALALLAEQNGIDLFEAERKNYQPIVEDVNYELNDVIDEINQDEEIATQMNDYIGSVPNSVRDRLTSEPDILRGLNLDMKQGIAQQIMPEVIKQLAINPNQDFVRLYQQVGTKVFSQGDNKVEEVVKEQPKQPKSTREDKKKVAVNKKTTTIEKKSTVDDYDASWNDDKHFNDVLQRLSGF